MPSPESLRIAEYLWGPGGLHVLGFLGAALVGYLKLGALKEVQNGLDTELEKTKTDLGKDLESVKSELNKDLEGVKTDLRLFETRSSHLHMERFKKIVKIHGLLDQLMRAIETLTAAVQFTGVRRNTSRGRWTQLGASCATSPSPSR